MIIKSDKEKIQAIERIKTSKNLYLNIENDDCIGLNWVDNIDRNIQKINQIPNYYELSEDLYLGNWKISDINCDAIWKSNTFKMTDDEITKMMNYFNSSFIIDSFHDNFEWNIIIRV